MVWAGGTRCARSPSGQRARKHDDEGRLGGVGKLKAAGGSTLKFPSSLSRCGCSFRGFFPSDHTREKSSLQNLGSGPIRPLRVSLAVLCFDGGCWKRDVNYWIIIEIRRLGTQLTFVADTKSPEKLSTRLSTTCLFEA